MNSHSRIAGHGWGELLAEAQSRLEELNGNVGDSVLGDAVILAENEHFQGRWRGEGTIQTRNGTRNVYLVWQNDGTPAFLYQHSRLVAEVDEVQPSIGDTIVVLRGEDITWATRDGEERTVFAYSVVARPCDDPPPGAEQLAPVGSPSGSGESFDNDIPFTPTA